tara:strand:+ start:606 stop:1799 length:1194 start_codon:yes stop_codon:yes gene_type:complete
MKQRVKINEIAIVTSTINIPYFLEDVAKNLKKFKVKKFKSYVIGDVKTPPQALDYCRKLSLKYKYDFDYLSIKEQYKRFKNYKQFLNFIPKNNNVRKMIGTMLAYIDGYQKVIMIDDDNYPTNTNNFYKFHNKTSKVINSITSYNSNTDWFNVGNTMNEKTKIPFYPRGFPWSKRFLKEKISSKKLSNKKIVVNGGLVLGDPDVDAISRLFWPLDVTSIKKKYLDQFSLYKNNYCPFNDQNTSIDRSIIPIYYKPPSVLRNADIWTSYLIEKVVHSTKNDVVTFGEPLVRQFRNPHDFRKDYRLEEVQNRSTDLLIDILLKQKIQFNNYLTTTKTLVKKCLREVKRRENKKIKGKNDRHAHMLSSKEIKINYKEDLSMIKNFFKEYLAWLNLIEKLF